MKKLILFAAMILMTGIAFGQSLQKGNLIGTHVVTVTLQPGVTMEKFIDFLMNRVIPDRDKYIPNMKSFLVKGIRGENKDGFGMIIVFKSEADRDKYYKPDGTYTDLGAASEAKLKPVYDELAKLGTMTSKYDDWLVL